MSETRNSPNYQGQYAGFVSRLLAYAIDLLVAIGGFTFIVWLISTTVDLLQVKEIVALLGLGGTGGIFPNGNKQLVLRGILLIIGIWLYHAILLSLTNRTVGKAIMGLQVVPMKGGRIGFMRASVRYFGYILSSLPLFFGFLSVLISSRRQGWHDHLARTYVVYSWEALPNETFFAQGLRRLRQANEKRYKTLRGPESGQDSLD